MHLFAICSCSDHLPTNWFTRGFSFRRNNATGVYDKAVRGASHRCGGHASIVARMRETESLRRHAHVPEPCRKFRSESGDHGRRCVADFQGPLATHPACPRGGGVERV